MVGALTKIAVGVALENAIYNGQDVQRLIQLYSDPNMVLIRDLHDACISSNDHLERETAIFLQLGLDLGPLQGDPVVLAGEMREMEHLLYAYLNKYGRAHRTINDWLNYIANSSQSIIDGFWMDAKVLLSLAVQTSRHPDVEALKANPELRYTVETLQEATASYFRELTSYPLKLKISDEDAEVILLIQKPMLELLQNPDVVKKRTEDEYAIKVVRGSHSAIKFLMETRAHEAKRELQNVEGILEGWLDGLEGDSIRLQLESFLGNVRSALSTLM